jgi:triosephosphate isomerase
MMIVAGNWKMHGSSAQLESYVAALAEATLPPETKLLWFPPVAYLEQARRRLTAAGLQERLELGAQDLSRAPEGAFTGEVAGAMIRELGGRWVLVGHSERRQYHGESNELVAAKAEAALAAGLTPVVCVGETETQRDAGAAESVVRAQIDAVAAALGASLAAVAVAYEPVWAIGTGRTASAEQAQEMHAAIRAQLAAAVPGARSVPVLYGGSVKAANAAGLFAEPDIDGALVGGASLDAAEFAAIAAAAAGARGAGRT